VRSSLNKNTVLALEVCRSYGPVLFRPLSGRADTRQFLLDNVTFI